METSIVIPDFVDARIGPRGSLENLSQAEIEKLLDSRAGGLYQLFRKCALAVLNSGSESDNAKEIFDRYKDFEVELVRISSAGAQRRTLGSTAENLPPSNKLIERVRRRARAHSVIESGE